MVRLFPAIDIQNGRCVRLRRGDFARETVFSDDPVEVAERWVDEGAQFLHVVDLDGAREGTLQNLELVSRIAQTVPVPVQFGGGVRDESSLSAVRESPISRLVVGTAALLDEDFLNRAVEALGEDLIVAVDTDQGYVHTHGWKERSGMSAVAFAHSLETMGLREIVYTDISRDGMLEGVDVPSLKAFAEATGLEVIVSGGVTDKGDLAALKSLEGYGVTGVVVGRALYEGRFSLAEARAVLD